MKIALTVSPEIRLVVLEGKKLSFTDVHVTQTLATARTNSVILESDKEAEQEFDTNVSTYNMIDIDSSSHDEVDLVKKIVDSALQTCVKQQEKAIRNQLAILPF